MNQIIFKFLTFWNNYIKERKFYWAILNFVLYSYNLYLQFAAGDLDIHNTILLGSVVILFAIPVEGYIYMLGVGLQPGKCWAEFW